MDWLAPIDRYCERLEPGLWAEPLNLVSNLAFLLASVLAWRRMRAIGVSDRGLGVLVAQVFLVGIGSALFHSEATYWAMWADIVPIVAFLISYLLYFLRVVVALPWWQVGMGLLSFVGVSALGIAIPGAWLNDSNEYLGAMVALLALRLGARRERVGLLRHLTIAAGAFALSLTLRTVDLEVCRAFPLGTHFLWHCCNGVALFHVLMFAIERLAPDASAAA